MADIVPPFAIAFFLTRTPAVINLKVAGFTFLASQIKHRREVSRDEAHLRARFERAENSFLAERAVPLVNQVVEVITGSELQQKAILIHSKFSHSRQAHASKGIDTGSYAKSKLR